MPSPRISERVRHQVASRADHCCEYCRIPQSFTSATFSVDHIHPRSLGGATVLQNIAFACPACNEAKHDRIEGVDAATGEQVALFHPRAQAWGDHFAWSDDFEEILPLTSTGRVTIDLLEMNREGARNLRRVLKIVGIHPP